jgi:hypothetical protein
MVMKDKILFLMCFGTVVISVCTEVCLSLFLSSVGKHLQTSLTEFLATASNTAKFMGQKIWYCIDNGTEFVVL